MVLFAVLTACGSCTACDRQTTSKCTEVGDALQLQNPFDDISVHSSHQQHPNALAVFILQASCLASHLSLYHSCCHMPAVATAGTVAPVRGHPSNAARNPASKRTAPAKPAGRKLLTQQAVQATQKTASAQHGGDDHHDDRYNSGSYGGSMGGLIGGIIGGLVGGGNQYGNGGYPPYNGGYTPPHDNHGGHHGEHAGQVYYPPDYVRHGDHVDYVPGHYGPVYGGKRKLLAAESAEATKATTAAAATETAAAAHKANSWGGWGDTGHYDYHPGSYVPHGNHYHYMPGHYDYHNGPHWGSNMGGNSWGGGGWNNWNGWNSWAGR
ncbi:hypothetical protein COO60DRAFT_1576298 [Scenedesmus sp. NREL 46B-D3]|nr:hypothetical protein COO60DRAFT_1576298 [Scenedesmus sp. NREL 46B-D3]